MAGTKGRQQEFARYPKYREMYIRAFDRMIKERKKRTDLKVSRNMWDTGEDVFHWWMEDGVLPGQMWIEEMEGET
jgi:phosphoadenosine phosphosulfate reductase